MANKKLINISNLQKFLSKLNEKFALKKTMKGISEDSEGNIIIGEEGLVPTPNENSKGKFLRSDGEWALPSETAIYDSMTLEEGVAGVSEVDRVLNAKNLKQIVNSDGFLTSLDSSKLTGIINIENLPQGALERILIVSSKEERLTLLDTEVQLGDVVKEADTGLMYYVINTEKLNSEEGYTQFTAGSASSVPWSGVTDKPTIPTKTSDLTNDSDFAIDSDVVHKTGNETINGTKTFSNGPWVTNNQTTFGYSIKNIAIARNDIPSEYYHHTFRAHDKNNNILGEYCIEKSTNGDALLNMGVRSEDASGTQIAHGLQFRMTNDGSLVRFLPSANNKVHLGDEGAKWASVYATTYYGNLVGSLTGNCSGSSGSCTGNSATATSANSATYATTQATTDNSTKIATTAWVRTYVSSVVGSGSVGASISAYYSNATTLTAEGSSSSSGGSYPSDYSDYINISPTVGTIYTGSQLFGTLNASASGSKYSYSSSGSTVYQTTAKATANFSGALVSTGKYLCTTANAVKFRAFVSQGTTSNIGTATVSDNSSAKSIFIRVQ